MGTLSNKAVFGLGIYLGFKPAYRRSEMSRFSVDYDQVVAELQAHNLIVNGKMNINLGREVFNTYVPNTIPSQTHLYKHILLQPSQN